MAQIKMLAHRMMMVVAIVGFGSATLFVAHETASAAVDVGSLVVRH